MKYTAIIITIVNLLTASAVYATNPADLTAFQRWSDQFYMVEADPQSSFLCATYPIGSVSATYLHWQDNAGKTEQDQITLVQSVSEKIDLAFDADTWKNGDSNPHLTADWHQNGSGVGLVAPLHSTEGLQLGLRQNFGMATAFASLGSRKPMYGLSFCSGAFNYDAAIGGESKFLRITYNHKNGLAEQFRGDFSPGETTIGFAISFCP